MEFDIISANFNNESYLDSYFKSIINSDLQPKTVIIVDDTSTDKSVEVIKKYSSSLDINLILNTTNIGFANSLNKAMDEIKSPYFARLDPDDYVHVERFRKQMEFLKLNPSIDLVGSNIEYVRNGVRLMDSNVDHDHKAIAASLKSGIMTIIHGSIMGKSKILQGFRYKQELVPAEDYEFFCFLLSKNRKLANLIDALTMVNIHISSVSNDLKFEAVKYRFELANQYFGTSKKDSQIMREFLHLKYYRRYMFEATYKNIATC